MIIEIEQTGINEVTINTKYEDVWQEEDLACKHADFMLGVYKKEINKEVGHVDTEDSVSS